MEDTKQLTLMGNETPEQAEAIGLHYEIVSAAQAAASSLLDLGRKLKRMRDSGKYKALGFETFGDYTEQAVHIRQRQAYTYINVVEKLPAQLIEENAAAGVTKLALLAKLGPQDREEVAGDLANITVTELQKLIDEKNDMAEQLSLLSAPPAAEAEAHEVDVEAELKKAADQARAEAEAKAAADLEALREQHRKSTPLSGVVTVRAKHISYQLSHIPVSPFTAGSCAAALQGLKTNAVEPCPFDFWTDKETTATFTVTEPASARSLLGGVAGSVLDVYGGEYEFNRYTVKLHKARGHDSGVVIAYGKNLVDIDQEESIENTITGVYPYYKDTNGNVLELPEKVVSSASAHNFPYPRTVPLSGTGWGKTLYAEGGLRRLDVDNINGYKVQWYWDSAISKWVLGANA